VIDVQPEPITLPEDSDLTLQVAGAGGDPLTFLWRKDGVALTDNGRVQGARTPTLSIHDATNAFSGEYDVVLTSPCGSTTSQRVSVSFLQCFHADYNRDHEVDIQDIFDFLNGWFAGDPAADLDGDGLSTQDIFSFLNSWFLGCI
jgi:hypothetical protein